MLNVQFLYQDRFYHYPIVATQVELLKHGVKLQAQRVSNIEQANASLIGCDLLMVVPKLYHEGLEKFCVALVSKLDGGLISPHAELISKVAGTIESYAYTPRKLHNLPYYRLCLEYLRQAGYDNETKFNNDTKKDLSLSDSDLAKVNVYCGFGSWERMIDITELGDRLLDWNAKRTIPIHFAGTTKYCGTEIQSHRRKAVEVCKTLGGVGINDRTMDRLQYHTQLLNSKAVLSPWGWGEACHRDWEALALGCVLIKPDWSFVESFPDISSHDAPYIPCKPDFSDVPEIMDRLVNNWNDYIDLRIRGRALAKEALNIKSNAKRLASIIKRIVDSQS